MKAGFATSTPHQQSSSLASLASSSSSSPPHLRVDDCQIIPNCLAKDRGKHIWVGSQLEKCNDFGEIAFRRPVEKGFLVNWEAEKAIWDNTFFEKNAKLKASIL